MYLYIGSIEKWSKTPKHHIAYICRLPIPLACVRFFCRGGCVNGMREGRGLNLTIGQLFCQYFLKF